MSYGGCITACFCFIVSYTFCLILKPEVDKRIVGAPGQAQHTEHKEGFAFRQELVAANALIRGRLLGVSASESKASPPDLLCAPF